MKTMLAALVATAAIAIVAAVFAIWPAVGDAPWEDDAPASVEPVDRTGEVRCAAALEVRAIMIEKEYNFATPGFPAATEYQANEREIDRYC